jgi:hypothetical protein
MSGAFLSPSAVGVLAGDAWTTPVGQAGGAGAAADATSPS